MPWLFLCTGSTHPYSSPSVRGSSGVGSLFQETVFGVLADARALKKQPKKEMDLEPSGGPGRGSLGLPRMEARASLLRKDETVGKNN